MEWYVDEAGAGDAQSAHARSALEEPAHSASLLAREVIIRD